MTLTRAGLWNDHPVTRMSDDGLSFCDYADVLCQVIYESNTPLSVGVFGTWGTGKTSLMRLLEEKVIQRRSSDHRQAIPVWFNAWRYDKDVALWRTFILAVLSSLRSRLDESPEGRHLLSELDDLETSLYREVDREEKTGNVAVDWEGLIRGSVRGTTRLILPLIPGLGLLSELLKSAQGEAAKGDFELIFSSIRRQNVKIHRDQLRSIEQFQGKFAQLLKEFVISRNRFLVVFIDDLDRCLPEHAIELLESVKLFLDVEGCVFVIGADKEIIERGVQVRYQSYVGDSYEAKGEAYARPLPVSGQSYLEKIIQLPFHLPALSSREVRNFVKSYDPTLPTGCEEVFAIGLEPNPRKVKRTLNVYRLLLELANARFHRFGISTVQPVLLAKIAVIQDRFTALYRDIQEYPNLLTDLEAAISNLISKPASESQEAGQLPDHKSPEVIPGIGKTLVEKYIEIPALVNLLRLHPQFNYLPGEEVAEYVYLIQSTDQSQAPASGDSGGRYWDDLLSADVTRIERAVDVLKSSGLQQVFAERLAKNLNDLGIPLQARLQSSYAISFLGDPRDLSRFLPIEGGTFNTGLTDEQYRLLLSMYPDWSQDLLQLELPGDVVPVAPFRIGQYPVTNTQYKSFVDATGHPIPAHWISGEVPRGLESHPVVNVCLYDALAYTEWFSSQIGEAVTLPTGIQWGRAARGSDTRLWPWGNDFDSARCNSKELGIGRTTAVGSFPSGNSPFGVCDVAGNVWEWTLDSPQSSSQDEPHLVRGGSWDYGPIACRATAVLKLHARAKLNDVGFRCSIQRREA